MRISFTATAGNLTCCYSGIIGLYCTVLAVDTTVIDEYCIG